MMAIRHLAPCCWIMLVLMASAALAPSTAFVLPKATRPHNNHPCCCCPQISLSSSVLLFMHHTEDFDHEIVGDDAGGVVIEDLAWRVEQLRLEEQNKQRFLKAKARFLPYEECRKWVQAWGQRWETKEDWQEWISMGEKRNPYIPSAPDEYYGRLGTWVSWDHFLLEPPKEDDDAQTTSDDQDTS